MEFGDSPQEAAFRRRARDWLDVTKPGLPAFSTSDQYWAKAADWHQALYDAGFFGLSWPQEYGGHGLPAVYDVILDEELAAAGAPSRPGLGYLVRGFLRHASDDVNRRFLPGIISGRDRWCQGFSEPEAGSDLASLRTSAERDGDRWIISGHKIWTSYSDSADWCLLLARTDATVPRHRGLTAFAVPMHQPGVRQQPITMINGVTREFGEVFFDGATARHADMIGPPGEGWALAMTVVSHEREPGELGYVARYAKAVSELVQLVRQDPGRYPAEDVASVGWAVVEAEMLRVHACRRLSERLDGISPGPGGSVDKLLMTEADQAVGHAALAVSGFASGGGDDEARRSGDTGPASDADGDSWLRMYLYSRAASVMGGTSEIQRNVVATRVLGLPVA